MLAVTSIVSVAEYFANLFGIESVKDNLLLIAAIIGIFAVIAGIIVAINKRKNK